MIGALGLIGGKYRLLRELGRGAFGAVYGARHEPSGELVALKLLARFDQPRAMERFRREAIVLSRLAPHPNIVRVLESGEHGGLPFVAMELVRGGSLASAMRDGRRPTVAQAARICEQVALGLDHLHRSGIVHRDVNANNVLLDEQGNARLVDFGLALDTHRVTRITETGELLGTPLTFAPEQLDGKADGVGPAADIYAASALLYELATGRSPFVDAKSFRELATRIRGEMPLPADDVNPEIPRGLARAIELGISKRPEDRPKTGAELARLIREGMRPGQRSSGEVVIGGAPRRAGEGSRFLPTADAVARFAFTPEPPAARTAGPWELGEVLGRGARGVVYRARHVENKSEAAVKVFALGSDMASACAKLEEAAQVQKAIDHPNVVNVFGAGFDQGFGWVAMELAPGLTLRQLVEKEKRLEPVRALDLAAKVARGIAAAHAFGVVHGDLNANHVVVDETGTPRVAGFGLEMLIRRGDPNKAPEAPAELKARDVFALGALLYELLAGRPPWPEGPLGSGGAPPPNATPPPAPVSGVDPLAAVASQIALRALERRAQDRHPDALSFAVECERARGSVPLKDRLFAFAKKALKKVDKIPKTKLLFGAGLGASLLVGGLVARKVVVERRLAEATTVLEQARQASRTGSPSREVAALVHRALELAADDEARLVDGARLLAGAGDVHGARARLEDARVRLGSLEALYELDRLDPAVAGSFECVGALGDELVNRAAEARGQGPRATLVAELARARSIVDRSSGKPEALRQIASSLVTKDGALVAEAATVRALLLHEAGDAGPAEAEATLAIDELSAQRPRDARMVEPLFLRARARVQQGKNGTAERDLDEVLLLAPKHARALAWRAFVRAKRRNATGAKDDLASADAVVPPVLASFRTDLERARAKATFLLDRSLALAASGDLAGALESADRALEVEPRSGAALVRRAELLAERGDLDEAVRTLDVAVGVDSSRVDLALVARGEALLRRDRTGDRDLARADFERAATANPKLARAWVRLGELELGAGNLDASLARFDKAAAADPTSGVPLRLRARVHRKRNDGREALEDLGRAIAADPQDPESSAERGALRLNGGPEERDYAEAIKDFDRALALEAAATHPLRGAWLAQRGTAHLERGDYGLAIEDLTRALAEQEDPLVLANRARAHASLNALDAAIKDIQHAIALENRNGGDRVRVFEERLRNYRARRGG